MKSSRRISAFALGTLMLALILGALPAGATPPEELSVAADLAFNVFSGDMHGTGTWYAVEGLIVSSGAAEEDASHAGWPPGYIFKTTHTTETWVDEYGSITIQTQLNVDEWTIIGFPCNASFQGSGNWVIRSGDGAYENIRGQGTVTVVGEITPDTCPYLNLREFYVGSAHIEP
jgi:hypothetical protein